MKKIFILPILILPIAATAADPVGPAHVNSGAVVATAPAPYETATEQTGDSTTVVSASYVKGAYNDAIAAVNKVNADKQDNLYISRSGSEIPIHSEIIENLSVLLGERADVASRYLISAVGVKDAINTVDTTIANKRISAVTTWGNDNATQLELSSLPAQP